MKKISKLAVYFCAMLLVVILAAVPLRAYAAETVESTQAVLGDALTEDETNEGSDGLTTDEFRVRVVPGLNGYYKMGAAVPLMIYLESMNEDFEGLVRVIVPSGEYGTDAVAYEKEIMLTAGSEKAISMSVENVSAISKMKMELENSAGKVVLEYEIEAKSQANESALVGILSNDFTALNYFDGKTLNFNSYQATTQVVELDADTLPDQDSGLDALGYLVINSFDTSLLSEEQYEALKGWVENGGVLIIGTGSDYKQTLSGFQDGFIGGNIGAPRTGELNLAAEEDGVSFTEADGIVDLSVEGGYVLDAVMSIPELIWTKDCGQGHVVMTAFNLGMEPVSGWSQKDEMAELLLTSAASGYSAQRIENLNYGTSTNSWTLSNALDSLHDVAYPPIKLLAVLFVVFVFFAGPGLYLILKAADKREWMWGMVPALAVVVTAGVFLFSRDLRITDPISASVTTNYYDAKSDAVSRKAYLGIQVPEASKEEIALQDKLFNLHLIDGNINYMWYDSFYDSADSYDYKAALRELSEGYLLTTKNAETFQSTYLTADCAADTGEEYGLDTKVSKNLSGIRGTVTNNTGYDMMGVSVYADSRVVLIGDLKAGESVDFTESDNITFSVLYMGFPGYQYDDWVEDQALLSKLEGVWGLFSEEYLYSMDAMDVYTFAWIPEWDADYMAQEDVKEVNTAMMVRRDVASYENYPDATATTLFQYTSGSPQTWDTDGWMYASEVEVSFDISTVFSEVYALIRAEDDASPWGNTGTVTVYGYNFQTGEYDELFTDGLTMEFPDGFPYMDENGMIKMKFVSSLADETDYAPEITVIGGGR